MGGSMVRCCRPRLREVVIILWYLLNYRAILVDICPNPVFDLANAQIHLHILCGIRMVFPQI